MISTRIGMLCKILNDRVTWLSSSHGHWPSRADCCPGLGQGLRHPVFTGCYSFDSWVLGRWSGGDLREGPGQPWGWWQALRTWGHSHYQWVQKYFDILTTSMGILTSIWRILYPSRSILRASLVAQWLGIRLPMQGTWVRVLVREDPSCCRAAGPVSHNYWACALEPASHNYWARVPQLLEPVRLEPVLCNKRSHCNEKPAHHNEELPPLAATAEGPRAVTKSQCSQKFFKKSILKFHSLIWFLNFLTRNLMGGTTI